jgi:hypothetical protein
MFVFENSGISAWTSAVKSLHLISSLVSHILTDYILTSEVVGTVEWDCNTKMGDKREFKKIQSWTV